jgi:arylsulfatase
VPAFAADVAVPRDSLYFHHEHNRALRIGDWKAVTRRPATNEWALYHVGRDRGEQQDLSAAEPERVRTMAAEWDRLTALHAIQSK